MVASAYTRRQRSRRQISSKEKKRKTVTCPNADPSIHPWFKFCTPLGSTWSVTVSVDFNKSHWHRDALLKCNILFILFDNYWLSPCSTDNTRTVRDWIPPIDVWTWNLCVRSIKALKSLIVVIQVMCMMRQQINSFEYTNLFLLFDKFRSAALFSQYSLIQY